VTPEEREQMARLVARIQVEKDHEKFIELVRQLNDLCARKERRLEAHNKPQSS
jgi:hypothetical protein